MIAPAYPTLLSFFDGLYRPRRLMSGSAKTTQQYHVAIRHFSRFLDRDAMVTDLDEDRLFEILEWFHQGPPALHRLERAKSISWRWPPTPTKKDS